MKQLIAIVISAWFLSACSPEVGSQAWCDDMKAKDKGQWTAEEASNFAKSCLLK